MPIKGFVVEWFVSSNSHILPRDHHTTPEKQIHVHHMEQQQQHQKSQQQQHMHDPARQELLTPEVLAIILQHVPQQQRLTQCALVSANWTKAAGMATTSLSCPGPMMRKLEPLHVAGHTDVCGDRVFFICPTAVKPTV